MILNALVYTVIKEVSILDEILDILTAAGTITAVIVSLYFSNDQKRIKKAEEIKDNKLMKEIVYCSLNNSLERMLRYREVLENANFLYQPANSVDGIYSYYKDFEISILSYKVGNILFDYINKNLSRDILFISTQLIILKDMDINRVSLEWVNNYNKAVSNLILLEKTLEEIDRLADANETVNAFLKNFNDILTPIEEIAGNFKNSELHEVI